MRADQRVGGRAGQSGDVERDAEHHHAGDQHQDFGREARGRLRRR